MYRHICIYIADRDSQICSPWLCLARQLYIANSGKAIANYLHDHIDVARLHGRSAVYLPDRPTGKLEGLL